MVESNRWSSRRPCRPLHPSEPPITLHAPLGLRHTDRTLTSVAEIRPTRCDAGHPIDIVEQSWWHPWGCGGHRVYLCRCGTRCHYGTGD